VQQDQLAQQDLQDIPDPWAPQAALEQRDLLVSQEQREILVTLELLDHLDLLEIQDRLVPLERQDLLVLLAHLVKEHRELDPSDLPELQEAPEQLEFPDRRVEVERRAPLAQLAQLGPPAPWDPQEELVQRVLMD
jgi:hypothetical protein